MILLEEKTDGYYQKLVTVVNGMFTSVSGLERVFSSRFGYDPNYTDAAHSEAIMKAGKILNFNDSRFIESSRIASDPIFTYANGYEEPDFVHYTVKGLNAIAEEVAQSISWWLQHGTKPSLSEPCINLQSVTDGTIDLSQDWTFNFNNSLSESNLHATTTFYNRNSSTSPTYESGTALIFNLHDGLKISRYFKNNQFFLETRLKLTGTSGENAILGDQSGGTTVNKFYIEGDVTGVSNNLMYFHGATWSVNHDWSQYHTYRFVGNGSTITAI